MNINLEMSVAFKLAKTFACLRANDCRLPPHQVELEIHNANMLAAFTERMTIVIRAEVDQLRKNENDINAEDSRPKPDAGLPIDGENAGEP